MHTESSSAESSADIVSTSDIINLPELNPPSVMPQGNVGTPLATFLELIQSCKLPSQVIKKLKLEFPRKGAKRRYGAVPMEYGTGTVVDASGSPPTSYNLPAASKKRKTVVDSDDESRDQVHTHTPYM